jgi:hypothetical protein
MQNGSVMTKIFELQSAKGWLNPFRISALIEYTEDQSKTGNCGSID